jgi:hypothetical protein
MRCRVDDGLDEPRLVALEDIVHIRRVEILECIVLCQPLLLVSRVFCVPLQVYAVSETNREIETEEVPHMMDRIDERDAEAERLVWRRRPSGRGQKIRGRLSRAGDVGTYMGPQHPPARAIPPASRRTCSRT